MILTVTLNPSVDISYRVEAFRPYAVNRSSRTIKTAGGKGLNVSRVLKILGADLKATGFLGGELGAFIKKELDRAEIKNDFLFTDKATRNCIAIISEEGQTEVLEKGPHLEKADREAFMEKYARLCTEADIVAISGSAPEGVGTDFIEEMIRIAKRNHARVIADMSGKNLKEIVFSFREKPFAIKPNLEEFLDLIGKNAEEEQSIKEALLEYTQGIELVMLSCGKNGAYIKEKNRVWKADIPKIESVNPIGSGDSTVAGLSYALAEGKGMEEAIKLANACGMSNCMNEKTGHIELDQVRKLKEKISLREI